MIKNSMTQMTNERHRWRGSADVAAIPQQQPLSQHEMIRSAERWVGDHPVLCVAAAISMGVILGCLIKRR